VQKAVVKEFPQADLDVFVVWISVMHADTYQAARKATRKFKDNRVKQFFDPKQMSGRAFAQSLGHPGKVAWDMYLFYPPKMVWKNLPPPAKTYFHQLRGSWADQSCLFEKNHLCEKLTETMELFFSKAEIP
jgi:hypothetical protein